MSAKKTVGFAGLGVMGFPMAGHLLSSGAHVVVYNRTTAKAEAWLQHYGNKSSEGGAGGSIATTPRELAERCAVVMTCLGNDEDVAAVYRDPKTGLLAGVTEKTQFVDHTTTSAQLAVALAADIAAAHGSTFIDAPVSGGEAGAKNGKLTTMIGGDPKVVEELRELLSTYAAHINPIGDVGSGQLCKMVNQICIAGTLQGLAEGITFAQKAGLSVEKVVKALAGGAAGSWQLENRGVTMAEDRFDFGFAIDWMRKDLGYCLDQARHMGIPLPMTKSVDDQYRRLQARGYNRLDTSVLIRQFLPPPPSKT